MSKSLVIVESPTKARTINRFLGSETQVIASMGHVRDLPERSLGVDIEAGFAPRYELTKGGDKIVKKLRQAAANADDIYLATDPDREGEAIAWHLQEALKEHTKATFHRVTFHEITASAIQAAFDHAHSLDVNKVDAQQARRVLDRIVGYKISPLLWRTVKKGTSAGRVQSVALRLVCEREREIQDFKPEEYWTLKARFQAEAATSDDFWTTLFKLDGQKPHVPNEETANELATELESATYAVVDVSSKDKRQRPAPPFMTSTLQQVAGARLRMSTRQTMSLAQQLYEGVDLGGEGAVGLITYMRTDSLNIAKEAQQLARAFVANQFGEEYVPKKPNFYKTKGTAQEAHEAIRPTDVKRTPEQLTNVLNANQLKLYRLIWERFVASQMASARLRQHTLDIAPIERELEHDYLFRATATETLFPGFMRVFQDRDIEEDDDQNSEATNELPEMKKGDACLLRELQRKQSFTEPPKRFSEATLVRELERNGVGRPSTYSSIVNTIQDREYTEKQKGRLHPTRLGFEVNDYLVSSMEDLFQVNFTAEMEGLLDKIEEGELDWTHMLDEFYQKFKAWVGEATSANAPENEQTKCLLDLFEIEEINWQEPTSRGRRSYDDRKFFESLRKQVLGGKKLTDKQWHALLVLAAKYRDQLPGLKKTAGEMGFDRELEEIVHAQNSSQKEGRPEPSRETRLMVDALADVHFEAPRKVGARTYDDEKFYKSLAQQVEGGRELTQPQIRVLKQFIARYKNQVENLEEIAENCTISVPENPSGTGDKNQGLIVALLEEINKWEDPVRRGRRVYDDKEFASSIREQFASRHELSERQINAVKKLLSKYRDQIPNYEIRAESLGLPTEPFKQRKTTRKETGKGKKEAKVVGKCPECGGDLLERQSRRGTFYGCSTFPKCRYTSNQLPQSGDNQSV
jgi:DNA topoisomerase-1